MFESVREIRKEYVAKGKKEILKEFNKLFDAHPKMTSVTWKQYTPYFNDGEACYFWVCEPYDDEIRFEEGASDQEIDDGFSAAVDLVNSMPSDLAEEVFGDHSQVTANRDGITVTSYEDHD